MYFLGYKHEGEYRLSRRGIVWRNFVFKEYEVTVVSHGQERVFEKIVYCSHKVHVVSYRRLLLIVADAIGSRQKKGQLVNWS